MEKLRVEKVSIKQRERSIAKKKRVKILVGKRRGERDCT